MKVIIFEKRKIFTWLIIFSVVLIFFHIYYNDPITSVMNLTTSGKGTIIVIDAGHGGRDPGAISNGVYEKDINLDIAKRLKKLLVKSGYKVIMTRATDTSIARNKIEGSYQKASLFKRAKIANDYKAKVMISIHCNADYNRSFKGAQTFYNNQSENSRKLALDIQSKLIKNMGSSRKITEGDFFLFKKTSMPTVLVEAGFLTNKEERNLLIQSNYRQKVAIAIAEGIINYVK